MLDHCLLLGIWALEHIVHLVFQPCKQLPWPQTCLDGNYHSKGLSICTVWNGIQILLSKDNSHRALCSTGSGALFPSHPMLTISTKSALPTINPRENWSLELQSSRATSSDFIWASRYLAGAHT